MCGTGYYDAPPLRRLDPTESLSILATDADHAALRASIHVFRVTEIEWVAARTWEEAKAHYKTFATGFSDRDYDEMFEDGDPQPMSEEALAKFRYQSDEDSRETISAREQLNRMFTKGEQFPAFFASSEF
jgi:hypothetical protein